ncbi:YybH family protein [Xanthomonas arboricola]|uniref:YybH family protein n=1 Tax=Xanthomonas arboricola TaxID=56448 RepID=UPI0009B8A91E|nr:nuclear transport factor 2 family protein [Xanthomonas arboricola]
MKLGIGRLIGTTVLASSVAFFALAQTQKQTKQRTPGPAPAQALHGSAEAAVDLPADLAGLLRAYEHAWQRNDASALSLLFSEDGFVLQNARPPVRGREAIRAAYNGQGGSSLRLRALAYDVSGDSGSIIGTYGFGQNTTETGKFTLTLRRTTNGSWLIRSDMENMNRPAQCAAVAACLTTPPGARPEDAVR